MAADLTVTVDELRGGDVLLYRPGSFFGRLIQLKTWHSISHVEIYLGSGLSSASRDGQGVNVYPVRLTELVYVLRPIVPVDVNALIVFTDEWRGTPYGWVELLDFVGLNLKSKGIICSVWATLALRRAGVQIFPTDVARKIAPFQFLDAVGGLLYMAKGQPASEAAAEM